jgi:hypothetical protein
MGFSLSWVAVRGRSAEDVRRDLRLIPTGERQEFPEAPFVGAALPGGWSLIVANRDHRFGEEELLARLSVGGETVACLVEDHSMVSQASGWKAGRHIWSVFHDGSDGRGRPEQEGEVPAEFAPILKALEEEQRGGYDDVDYLYDAPAELAKALVGFRHDQRLPDVSYEVLKPA